MGSETHLNDVPVIDFSNSNLKPGTSEWNSVKFQVQEALEKFGCFKGIFNKIHPELIKATFAATEELFNLPMQTKLLNFSPKSGHGYIKKSPILPLFESFGFDHADIPEETEKMTNNLWPQGNPDFSKTIQTFSKQVSQLEQIVKRMVVESLGLEKYMDEIMNATYYLLRVGIYAHKDPNTITILNQNADGLEIQTKDGEWIQVKASPDSFILLVGESFHAWTNGRVHTPYHRVLMTGKEARYSTGLFATFKAGCMIKPPEELVDDDHPLLYEPFDYGEFGTFRDREYPKGADISLKAYCGL
ncbi:hypothetical protein Tsubulata_842121 [Turnera subulata]|uniref:Fe2OG dioxygenase domain-containing protein n=1 Tax=Turnera subulata TaxID=218843 RepID=A0A9Q0JC33_9ROSI|nr:hypothetical protein Tsubulata_842121 [Turnera subulata]